MLTQMVLVTGEYAPDGSPMVCVWERHPAHTMGELYVVSGQTAAVAMTQGVAEAISLGRLKLVEHEDPAPVEVEEPVIAVAEVTEPPKHGRGKK